MDGRHTSRGCALYLHLQNCLSSRDVSRNLSLLSLGLGLQGPPLVGSDQDLILLGLTQSLNLLFMV